jgi:hypothetical protein
VGARNRPLPFLPDGHGHWAPIAACTTAVAAPVPAERGVPVRDQWYKNSDPAVSVDPPVRDQYYKDAAEASPPSPTGGISTSGQNCRATVPVGSQP